MILLFGGLFIMICASNNWLGVGGDNITDDTMYIVGALFFVAGVLIDAINDE
jgi:hypothetical protein